MKNASDLLRSLEAQGVKMWADGGQIRFEAPKGLMTQSLLLELKEKKSELISLLPPSSQRVELPAIVPAPDLPHYPLSFAQERMLLAEYWDGATNVNLMSTLVMLPPGVNPSLIEQALNSLLLRHDSLRTRFPIVEGRCVQVIHEHTEFELEVIDCVEAGPGREEIHRFVLARIEDAKRDSFRLESDLPLLAKLFRVGHGRYLLWLVVHHLVSDGWSMKLLFGELFETVDALRVGREAPLPRIQIRYVDVAVAQREWMSKAIMIREREYWGKQLEAPRESITLPRDVNAEATVGGVVELKVEGLLVESLRTICSAERATLFMLLLAVLKVWLHRISGTTDVIVGTPISGRHHLETEQVVGLFLNVLALRTDCSGDPSFRELLGRVRETALGAFEHQHIPFEKLVEDLQPDRDERTHPFFEVFFNYLNLPGEDLSGDPPPDESPQLPENPPRYPLNLYVSESGRRLFIKFVYDPGRISEARASLWRDQLVVLIEQVAADPERPLGSYTLLTRSTEPLMADPSKIIKPPAYSNICETIGKIAEASPSRWALIHDEMRLTYGELVEHAREVESRLAAAGVSSGEAVAVIGHRQSFSVVAILGIWMRGCVLLALDPLLPQERIIRILSLSGAKRLLTSSGLDADEAWLTKWVDVLSLNGNAVMPTARPSHISFQEDAAYLIFTSGTTGEPKGLVGSHQGLAQFLDWQKTRFDVCQSDRVAQLTNVGFDVVFRDLFLPLTSGGTLVLPPERGGAEPLDWLAKEEITIIHSVPSIVRAWLKGRRASPAYSPRLLFFAGEPLTDDLVAAWRREVSVHTRIVNLYGPSETTLAKCYYEVPQQPPPGIQPLGFPIPHTQVFVLRDRDRFCGIGEPGEIVLRTPFRCLGGLSDSGLVELGLENPFTGAKEDRFYRTGDRGRFGLKGELEFLGRKDRQIKIRGVRVEPTEVETALLSLENVNAAAVLAHKGEDSDNVLIAYLVVLEQPSTDEIRSGLRAIVPDAMVPSQFEFIDELPVTTNGKIDRNALPRTFKLTESIQPISPRTGLELTLASLFSELLDRSRVSVKDNFFDCGGHSLLAMRLIHRFSEITGREMSLGDLFRSPTVETLARVLENRPGGVCSENLVPLQLGDDNTPLFFVHPAGGTAFCYIDLIRELPRNQTCYGLQATGIDDDSPPKESVIEMASEYLEAIRGQYPSGPLCLVGWSFGGRIAFEMAGLIRERGEKLGFLVMIDSAAPEVGALLPCESDSEILAGLLGPHVEVDVSRMEQLEERERLDYLVELGMRLGIFPPGFGDVQTRRLLGVYKSHRRAAVTSEICPKDLPATYFFASRSRDETERADLRISTWRSLCQGGLDVHEIDANHYTILSANCVARLSSAIQRLVASRTDENSKR